MKKRISCRAIILKEGKIVLIRRIKNGKEYYVYPGGGKENNETLINCITREIKEELSVECDIINHLYIYNSDNEIQNFFLTEMTSGELELSGPEKEKNGINNTYEIVLIDIYNLSKYNIYPIEVTSVLMQDIVDMEKLINIKLKYLNGK